MQRSLWQPQHEFLKKLRLTRPEDQRLLDEDLALLDLLASQLRTQETRIKAANIADADTALIASIPGMGPILSAVVAAEPSPWEASEIDCASAQAEG